MTIALLLLAIAWLRRAHGALARRRAIAANGIGSGAHGGPDADRPPFDGPEDRHFARH